MRDVTADGRINALDLAAVKQRLGTRLPPSEPTAAAATVAPFVAASSVNDELFASTPNLG